MKSYLPMEIEKKSFEIIESELAGFPLQEGTEAIVKRVIHTSADFDYAKNMRFSKNAIAKALEAIKNGAHFVTDTQMAMAGINKKAIAKGGGEVHNFMPDDDVAKEAKERGVTRACVCMEKATSLDVPLIFAIGNAPTALIRLDELMREGKLNPVLIIAVPVGFVNVVESKELIMENGCEYIVAKGRKGGSNVAAAIVNALLYTAFDRD